MDFDVVIVGAGLVGASLALALRGSGLKLAVIETRTPEAASADWDSRVYAISPASVAFLDQLGIWRRLDAERVATVQEMRVYGDAYSAQLHFSAYEAGVSELAAMVEARLLQATLWRALEFQHEIEVLCPERCAGLSLESDAAELQLESGKRLRARLIVGADGKHSWVRAAAGIAVDEKSYEQRGVVANFSCERAHQGTAYQWFRQDGVLAYLPLPGARMSMVWSTADAHAQELLGLSADALCARVAQAGGEALGALTLLTQAQAFPLGLQRAAALVGPRVALVGDAGHVLHPLAGQGVNLGFGDARDLAQVLQQREIFRDPGELRLLRRYERARAEDILALAWVTDGLHRLFAAQSGAVSMLRNAGLNLTNGLPVVKNLLIRRALG